MAHKSREVYLWSLEVGECHHRRRSVIAEKHRKLIDEVAKGGLGSFLSVVNLRGKELIRALQLISEKARLFRLGFKVLIPLVQEEKIDDSDAPLGVFDFMFPAVADVLAVDLAVQPAGEQVIN